MEENDQPAPPPPVPDPRRLVAVLADTAKLRVFSALVLAASDEGLTLAQAAEAAGVSKAEAHKGLVNLTVLGLARRTGADTYAASPDVFRGSLSELNRRRD